MVDFGFNFERSRRRFEVFLIEYVSVLLACDEHMSRHTMIHLLPSNSFFGGFFVLKLSGLGFLPGGAGLDPLPRLDELSLRCGTVAPARSDGFLCVIWSAETFLSPDVTPSPLFRSANTAPMSAGLLFAADGIGGKLPGGGGGPGGGGMLPEGGGPGGGGGTEPDAGAADAPPDLISFSACAASTPCGFHCTPLG